MIRDIALAHGDDPGLRAQLRPDQVRALESIAACGTAAMGFHEEACDHCGDARLVPNTCGNRSCPHCQGRVRAQWVEDRTDELLPVGYFHVVMTLPPDLRALAKAFPSVVLGALMQAAPEVIAALCRNPRHLGGEVGQLVVLHTWRRDLGWHPHVHLIVTAGGWDAERQRWIPAKRFGPAKTAFLLPVEVLRQAFQRRMRTLLLEAYRHGRFATDDARPGFPELADLTAFTARLDDSIAKPWVLRIEPPFGGPVQVLKYLGAYVGRVAISPKRILAYDHAAATVTYTWTTNKEPDRPQQATIPAVEFLRRFAQHILPPRFQRIRFRGLWSTAHRETKLRTVQQALGGRPLPPGGDAPPPSPDPRTACSCCGRGHYQRRPGPCPRPSARDRRTALIRLRQELRTQAPQGAITAA